MLMPVCQIPAFFIHLACGPYTRGVPMNIPDHVRLDMRFEALRLAEDLERIAPEEWIVHFVKQNFDGEWSGVALRGPADATHPIQQLFASPDITNWTNTAVLRRCPYFAWVVEQFKCPLRSVRLLRLAPGSVIKEHRDYSLGFDDGEVRIHVPVQSDERVEFYCSGERITMAPGETWYVNVNQPHRVVNASDDYRVHLVMDCEVDPWLTELFRRSVEKQSGNGSLEQGHEE